MNSRYPVFKVTQRPPPVPGQSEIVQYLPSSSTASGSSFVKAKAKSERTKSRHSWGICLKNFDGFLSKSRSPSRAPCKLYGPFPSTHDCWSSTGITASRLEGWLWPRFRARFIKRLPDARNLQISSLSIWVKSLFLDTGINHNFSISFQASSWLARPCLCCANRLTTFCAFPT